MKLASPPLLVRVADAELRERVRRAAAPEYGFRPVPDWGALERELRVAPPSALVVADAYDGPGEGRLAERLRRLLDDFPSTVVFAALPVRGERLDDVCTLAAWGVAQIVDVGRDDTPEALQVRFRESHGRPLRALVERVLPAELPTRGRLLLDGAAATVAAGGNGREMARQLGLSRRTLLRWCERAALPPPRRLLAWMRILQAAQLLDDPGRTMLSVANACGYASDSGLRRVTQKFLGASPTELRRLGAFARASEVFLGALARRRAAAERRGRRPCIRLA